MMIEQLGDLFQRLQADQAILAGKACFKKRFSIGEHNCRKLSLIRTHLWESSPENLI